MRTIHATPEFALIIIVYIIYIDTSAFLHHEGQQAELYMKSNNIIIKLTWCLCGELNYNAINTRHFRKLVHGHFLKNML